MAAGVVIWEWQNEYGSWRPYSPQISSFLESNKHMPGPVHLGSVDPKLYLYQVDFQQMCQVRQGTGTQRSIRRSVQPSSSPLAKGITWQWEGDALGSWCDFDIDIISYLDECYHKGDTFIDLSKSKFFLPYHIDLKAMTQKRIETGRMRNIQRVFTSIAYPQDLSLPNSTAPKRGTNLTVSGGSVKKLRTATSVSSTASSVPTSNSSAFAPRPGLFGGGSATFQQSVSATNSSGTSAGSGLFGGNSQYQSNSVFPANNISSSNSHSLHTRSHFLHGGPVTRSQVSRLFSSNQSTSGNLPTTTQSMQVPMASAFPVTQSQNQQLPKSGSHVTTGTINPFQQGSNGPVYSGMGHLVIPAFGNLPGATIPPSGAFGTGFSSTVLPQPNLLPGNLNPSHLFGGSRPKVRPSLGASSTQASGFASGSSLQLPRYDRIPNYTSKSTRKSRNTGSAAEDILHNFVKILDAPPADDDCCICCEKLIEASGHGTGSSEDRIVYKLEKCSHMFHKLCLTAMYESGPKDGHVQCPTCKTIYGEKMGNCPKGDMEYKIIDHELPGYEGHKTIQIMYLIHSGTQGPEHPHPGKRYSARGFPRVGYLPDCDKGRKVLQLLIIAWKRRLTFTIGSSTTTGEDNTVTWNEIHHKTELGTNYSGHGYPDPKYLDNVLQELAVHGITENDLPSG